MGNSFLTTFFAIEKLNVEVNRLCFGCPIAQRRKRNGPDVSCVYRFHPGSVFGIARHLWRPDGRQHHILAIVEASASVGEGILVPNISPLVRIHALVAQSEPAGQGGSFDRFLGFIQSMDRSGIALPEINPDYWRQAAYGLMLHQRLLLPPGSASRAGIFSFP